MINLELPRFLKAGASQSHQAAAKIFRSISRKYDLAEHEYPKELDTLAPMMDGMVDGDRGFSGVSGGRGGEEKGEHIGVENGSNIASLLNVIETCRDDMGLTLSLPHQGLGNAAIAAVATDKQLETFGKTWASMAIAESSLGFDPPAASTNTKLDGDEYIIDDGKILVTVDERPDSVAVWATLDKPKGRAVIESSLVEKGTSGLIVECLEEKLGIHSSDTTVLRLGNVRVPKENLLGSLEIGVKKPSAGAVATFDNTRSLVAGMAIGVSRVSLGKLHCILEEAGIKTNYDVLAHTQSAAVAEYLRPESNWEVAHLLALHAARMANNKQPNALEASECKAKIGHADTKACLRTVQLVGAFGCSERNLLEEWSRGVRILDVFEGT